MIANSIKQPLHQHLISVGSLSRDVMERVVFNEELMSKEKFKRMSFLAGLFHDLGKIDPSFQSYINQTLKEKDEEGQFDGFHQDIDELETRATHNEISWAVLSCYNVSVFGKELDSKELDYINYAVYWHHKKLMRKQKFETNHEILSSLKNDYDKFHENLIILVSKLNEEYEIQFSEPLNLKIDPINLEEISYESSKRIPAFKDFQENTKDFPTARNSRKTFLRTVLIFSDRSVSSMGEGDLQVVFRNKRLKELINRGFDEKIGPEDTLSKAIAQGLNSPNFSNPERNAKQTEVANKMVNRKFSVLGGPPGCGKTKIALQKIMQENPKKIFWVCPRINVCQAVFEELYREYLPDLKVEIFTGEFKQIKYGDQPLRDTLPKEHLSGDVVIVTIDQILGILVKNGKANNFVKILDSHFVFDEFHEIFSIPGMIFILKELIYLFQNLNIPCLLMSATPNPSFLKKVVESFKEQRDLFKAWDFHDKDFNINFTVLDKGEDSVRVDEILDSIHIYNSIDKAQSDYLRGTEENKTLLFHSSFNKEDKQKIYKELMSNFGKRPVPNRLYEIVKAGPVIQASLNISANNLVTDVCSPENLIQRIGRCNRFAEKDVAYLTVLNYANKTEVPIVYLRMVEFSYNSSLEFFKFLQTNIKGPVKRSQLMQLYYDFHATHSSLFDKDWSEIEKAAFKFLANFEEIKYISKQKNKQVMSSGFRGDSVFILPITVNNEDKMTFGEYVYDIRSEHVDSLKTITISAQDMDLDQLATDYSSNCRSSGFKKRYNMKNDKYNSKKEFLLIRAKDPKKPIFVSFDEEDLKSIGTSLKNHNLVYNPFVPGKKSCGLITIEKLKQWRKNEIED